MTILPINFERIVKKKGVKKRLAYQFLVQFLDKKMLHKMVPIPLGIIGLVFGKRGRNLRAIEEETQVQKLEKRIDLFKIFYGFS